MKTAIKTFLAAVGLAPISYVERVDADLKRSISKIDHLEEQLAALRADAQGWKRRYEDSADALAGWKQAAHRAQSDAERTKGSAEKTRADLERATADLEREQGRAAEWRGRAEAWAAHFQELRTRMENANRATESANEQLMAMEVKLDLIEAAIQVLDTRTREQAVVRSR